MTRETAITTLTFDFGDQVSGRTVDDNDFRFTKPPRWHNGTVIGLFALAPECATIKTSTGREVTVKVESVVAVAQ